jgi:hypothetical protein
MAAAAVSYTYRGGYRGRGAYRRRGKPSRDRAASLIVAAVLAYAAGTKLVTPHTHAKAHPAVTDRVRHAELTTVTGPSETAYWAAVLGDLSAPATTADITSLSRWADHEGPWGTVGQYNPLDTTLYEPGSTAFNTLGDGGHVWNYPNASVGAHATAVTITGGYPLIVSALRSGGGLCGDSAVAGELLTWSGSGYDEVC